MTNEQFQVWKDRLDMTWPSAAGALGIGLSTAKAYGSTLPIPLYIELACEALERRFNERRGVGKWEVLVYDTLSNAEPIRRVFETFLPALEFLLTVGKNAFGTNTQPHINIPSWAGKTERNILLSLGFRPA